MRESEPEAISRHPICKESNDAASETRYPMLRSDDAAAAYPEMNVKERKDCGRGGQGA